jgi:hypothetical protein
MPLYGYARPIGEDHFISRVAISALLTTTNHHAVVQDEDDFDPESFPLPEGVAVAGASFFEGDSDVEGDLSLDVEDALPSVPDPEDSVPPEEDEDSPTAALAGLFF